MQITYSDFRNQPHVSCKDLATLSGCKPYLLNQTVAKLVNNRLMVAPYESRGTKHIPLESFYVLAKHIKFTEEVYEEIVTGYQMTDQRP